MALNILIDADGCPVVADTVRMGKKHHAEVTIICDTAHEYSIDGAETITVSKGADSADFAIVNMLKKGDLVVTQDYGLAAICLARGARVINQDGKEYTNENIDALLSIRHIAKKERMSGKRHMKGPSKRTESQNQAFITTLEAVLKGISSK